MREADQLRKITDYFKRNFKKGYTADSLKWALIGQGYSRTAVEKSIEQANKELAKEAPILKEKPVIRHDIIDENNMPVEKKSWFRSFFRL